MSSGRSARLPPTPNAAAIAAASATTTARGIHEPNSNNILPTTNPYGHIKSNSNNINNTIIGSGSGGGGGVGGIGSVGGVGSIGIVGSGSGGNGIAGRSMMSGMTGTSGMGGMTGMTSMTGGGYTNVNSGGGGGGVVMGGVGYGSGSITTIDAATEGIPCETIDALGPELAVATSQVLENLSETERKMIIEVLNRDENVRQRDATRIM